MIKKNSDDGHYASPTCYATEFDIVADAQQQQDLANWRKAERQRQRLLRRALTPEQQINYAAMLAKHLDTLLVQQCGDIRGRTLGGYWPIQGEFDLLPWFHALHDRGVRIALPVTLQQESPLIFRAWTPDTIMEKDCWNIPVPPTANEQLTPDILLAPCVAWDKDGYRLGYGGGYFDRTLASLKPKPFVIGVGLHASYLPTIFPQPYDVPMDAIATETGVQRIAPA